MRSTGPGGAVTSGELVAGVAALAAELAGRPAPDSGAACYEQVELLGQAVDLIESAIAARVAVAARSGVVAEWGHTSAVAWLRTSLGMRQVRAEERAVLAEQLPRLPRVAERLAAGELSAGYAVVIAAGVRRLGAADCGKAEALLLGFVDEGHSVGQVARFAEKIKDLVADRDGTAAEPEDGRRGERQWLGLHRSGAGAFVKGRFGGELLALIKARLEPLARPCGAGDTRDHAERLADALQAVLSGGDSRWDPIVVIELTQLAGFRPADEPAGSKSATEQPAGSKPTAEQPAGSKPTVGQPPAEPMTGQPAAGQPVVGQPGESAGPIGGQPAGRQTSAPDMMTRARPDRTGTTCPTPGGVGGPPQPVGDTAREPHDNQRGDQHHQANHDHQGDLANEHHQGEQNHQGDQHRDQGDQHRDQGDQHRDQGDQHRDQGDQHRDQGDLAWSIAPGDAATGGPAAATTPDAGAGPDAGPDAGPIVGPDASSIVGPDAGPDAAADVASDVSPVAGPDVGSDAGWASGDRSPGWPLAGARFTARLADGTPIPTERARQILLNAGFSALVLGTDGLPLYLGRRVRCATPAQHRVLQVRYSTCVVDGCEIPASACQADHVDGWEHGQPTDIDRLVPCCAFHNRYKWRHPDRVTVHQEADGRYRYRIERPTSRRHTHRRASDRGP
jgi:hypothetical protein